MSSNVVKGGLEHKARLFIAKIESGENLGKIMCNECGAAVDKNDRKCAACGNTENFYTFIYKASCKHGLSKFDKEPRKGLESVAKEYRAGILSNKYANKKMCNECGCIIYMGKKKCDRCGNAANFYVLKRKDLKKQMRQAEQFRRKQRQKKYMTAEQKADLAADKFFNSAENGTNDKKICMKCATYVHNSVQKCTKCGGTKFRTFKRIHKKSKKHKKNGSVSVKSVGYNVNNITTDKKWGW
jgi:ribosomal protein L40E